MTRSPRPVRAPASAPVPWTAVPLSPEQSAGAAARLLLTSLADRIDALLPGTIGRHDIEFLHQLRVAVRRTRSGIKAFGGIYPDAALDRFAPGFRWLQQVSGPARDLDVQLAGYDDALAGLPLESAARLEPLRELLTLKHEAAHWSLHKALTSHRYADLVRRWRGFLDQPADGPEAAVPVRQAADRRIAKAYRRVVKPARRITPDSPADALHDVRKRAKELRYLLEFFASLYPDEAAGRLLKALRKLQDHLGEFQDAQVQAARLREWGEELSLAGAGEPTMLALGALVVRHEATGERLRGEFAARFARFDAPANRARFDALVDS